jgi:hypothetical protein
MLRWETRVQGAGLNEKRLLNHDRFGEGPEVLGEEAPDRSGENGTGSMMTTNISASGPRVWKERGKGTLDPPFFFFLSMPKASWPLWAEKPDCLLPQLAIGSEATDPASSIMT